MEMSALQTTIPLLDRRLWITELLDVCKQQLFTVTAVNGRPGVMHTD